MHDGSIFVSGIIAAGSVDSDKGRIKDPIAAFPHKTLSVLHSGTRVGEHEEENSSEEVQ
jgi:hypothetical protein